MRLAAVLLCVLPVTVWAQQAPTEALRPEARSATEPGADAEGDPDAVPEAASPEEDDAAPPSATASPPEADEPEPSAVPLREQLAETPADLAACLAALDGLDVAYARAEPVTDPTDPDCGIANPIEVSALGRVAIEPPAELRCATALAAARWVEGTVRPAAARLEGRGTVAALVQGTGYLCRARVGDDDTISEHALGNALDVAAFRFEEGEPLTVTGSAGKGDLDEAFVAAVRGGACLDFTTVLGPGTNAEHEDHLHLDIKLRDGGFRLCQ